MIVLTILFFAPQINLIPYGSVVLTVLVWIMVAITVISGADYLIKNKDVIKMD